MYKDKSEWAQALEDLNVTRKVAPWRMARIILWGIEHFCPAVDRDCISDLYDDISEQLEVQRKTLQNYASVARRFDDEDVRERLEIGHHIAVVAMPKEVADFWLDKAEMGAWSVQKMRMEIKKAGQVVREEEEEDDGTGRGKVLSLLHYYGVVAEGTDNSLTMGFPDGKFVTVSAQGRLQWQLV